jgi:hypothetical protein
MQAFIDNPKRLKKVLLEAFCPVVRIGKITTNNRSVKKCIADLKQRDFYISEFVGDMLQNKKFVVTNGITYELVLIKGDEFTDRTRTPRNIRKLASAHGLLAPPVGLGPYLREMFSGEDLKKMGFLELVLMHEPVTFSSGIFGGLYHVFDVSGDHELKTCDCRLDVELDCKIGFVFWDPAK